MRLHSLGQKTISVLRRNVTATLACLAISFLSGCGDVQPSDLYYPGPPVVKPVLFRFAVFGDAEPKPDPDFENLSAAVDAVNELSRILPIDFVASVGDIAHQGKEVQYQMATSEIERLEAPFYAIMGNEEFGGGLALFKEYAAKWNDDPDLIPGPSYSFAHKGVQFVFAGPDAGGRDFTNEGVEWILSEFEKVSDASIVLFTHVPAPDTFPDGKNRSISNPEFSRVLSHPRLAVVFSGHLHLNLDDRIHIVESNGVLHVHVPGLERTKVGRRHVPRFRLVTVFADGDVLLETFNVSAGEFEDDHFDLFPQLVSGPTFEHK